MHIFANWWKVLISVSSLAKRVGIYRKKMVYSFEWWHRLWKCSIIYMQKCPYWRNSNLLVAHFHSSPLLFIYCVFGKKNLNRIPKGRFLFCQWNSQTWRVLIYYKYVYVLQRKSWKNILVLHFLESQIFQVEKIKLSVLLKKVNFYKFPAFPYVKM